MSAERAEMKLARFLTREPREVFNKALSAHAEKAEKELIDAVLNAMAKKLAEYAWKTGYDIKDFNLMFGENDRGRLLTTFTEATGMRRETVRQWCYQFVRLAEEATTEMMVWRKEFEDLDSKLLVRIGKFMRLI